MDNETVLQNIREQLFYGVGQYTKNLPDFIIPENLRHYGNSVREEFFTRCRDALVDQEEVLVYFHIPFCWSECAFCNTFPHPVDSELQGRYFQGILDEIAVFAREGVLAGKRVRCIYFGGGTPTTFSDRQLGTLIEAVAAHAPLAEGVSISCEATPATLQRLSRIQQLGSVGIDRLSLGCQTFDPQVLETCRRTHTADQIREIVDTIHHAGLTANIDIMLGLPGQTLDMVDRDLALLDVIGPDAVEFIRHEIVNPHMITLLEQRPELVVVDDDLFAMTLKVHEWSEAHGLEQNGRFRDGRNYAYRYHWVSGMPLLAFGLRTRSCLRDLSWENHEDFAYYFKTLERQRPPVARFQALSPREQMYRALFMGLQLERGVDRQAFQGRFGEDILDALHETIAPLQALGVVETPSTHVRLSHYGRYFFEDVMCFIMDTAKRVDFPQHQRTPFNYGTPMFKSESP